MSKQTKFLIGMALVMAYLYVSYFTNWFSKKSIQIDAKPRSLPSSSAEPVLACGMGPLVFESILAPSACCCEIA